MKQVFKGQILTRTKVVNNILRTYQKREDADVFDWYQEAHEYAQQLSRQTSTDVARCCGIIAALSPLKTWEQNKIIAYSFLSSGRGQHTRVMKTKAREILKRGENIETICEILNGNKITAFFMNILRPQDSSILTIDRHAIAISLGRDAKQNEQEITAGQYNFFVECYTIAAAKVDIKPIMMQSITWEAWRRLKRPPEETDDVPF